MNRVQSELFEGKDPQHEPNAKLIEMEDVTGTPFKVIGSSETGYFIAIGKYRLSEHKDTMNEAIQLLSTKMWEIITNLTLTLITLEREHNNQAL